MRERLRHRTKLTPFSPGRVRYNKWRAMAMKLLRPDGGTDCETDRCGCTPSTRESQATSRIFRFQQVPLLLVCSKHIDKITAFLGADPPFRSSRAMRSHLTIQSSSGDLHQSQSCTCSCAWPQMFKRRISCSWVRQRMTYSLPNVFELGDGAILLGVTRCQRCNPSGTPFF